jgi:hypothetical protein
MQSHQAVPKATTRAPHKPTPIVTFFPAGGGIITAGGGCWAGAGGGWLGGCDRHQLDWSARQKVLKGARIVSFRWQPILSCEHIEHFCSGPDWLSTIDKLMDVHLIDTG